MNIYVFKQDMDFPPIRTNNEGRTVSVFLRGNGNLQNYRCNTCGKIVFQYSGEVESVYDGAKIPEEKATIDILCQRCRVRYRVI